MTPLNYGMLLDIHNWSSPRAPEVLFSLDYIPCNNNYVMNKAADTLYLCLYL